MTLENIIELYLVGSPDNNIHPHQMNKDQVTFVQKHWDEAKPLVLSWLARKKRIEVYDLVYSLGVLREHETDLFSSEEQNNLIMQLATNKEYSILGDLQKINAVSLTKTHNDLVWDTFFTGSWKPFNLKYMAEDYGKPTISQKKVNSLTTDWLKTFAGLKKTKEFIQPNDFSLLFEYTGLTPNWDKNLIGEVYKYWIEERNHLHSPMFIFLREFVGASPNEKDIHKYYSRLLSKTRKDHGQSPVYGQNKYVIDAFLRDIEITGIRPKKSVIDKVYDQCLSVDTLKNLKKLQELSGTKLTAKHINKTYVKLLQKGYTESITDLEKATGVPPDFTDDNIQKAYGTLFKEGRINVAREIYERTGKVPELKDTSIITKNTEHIITQLETSAYYDSQRLGADMVWLVEHYPNESAPGIQQKYRNLILNKQFTRLEGVRSWLKVDPLPEEKFVLACVDGKLSEAKKLYNLHNESINKIHPEYALLMN